MFPLPMMPTPMDATLIRSLAAFRPILGKTHGAASRPTPCLRMVRRPTGRCSSVLIDVLPFPFCLLPRREPLGSLHVPELLEIPLADLRGLPRGIRHVPRAIELVHD